MANKREMSDRGFYWFKKMRYAETCPVGNGGVDEVMFGFYPEDGGTTGEVAMRWYDGKSFDEDKLVARLECYEDAFGALSDMLDVVKELRDAKMIQPEEFCGLLKRLGFKDRYDNVD